MSKTKGDTAKVRSRGLNAIVRAYTTRIRPRAEEELAWFRDQPNLAAAGELAALAINSQGKRYAHQRRLRKADLERARRAIISNLPAIAAARDFHGLFTLLDSLLGPIEGIGELYIYDTALRLGAHLHLLPRMVYLHTGTRTGARALDLDTQARALPVSAMPLELRELEPHEIEDLLCIFKDDFTNPRRGKGPSWCA